MSGWKVLSELILRNSFLEADAFLAPSMTKAIPKAILIEKWRSK
jgi:hypothetical protein